jgi:hypothetical protein
MSRCEQVQIERRDSFWRGFAVVSLAAAIWAGYKNTESTDKTTRAIESLSTYGGILVDEANQFFPPSQFHGKYVFVKLKDGSNMTGYYDEHTSDRHRIILGTVWGNKQGKKADDFVVLPKQNIMFIRYINKEDDDINNSAINR